jgi:hypothetical protein
MMAGLGKYKVMTSRKAVEMDYEEKFWQEN